MWIKRILGAGTVLATIAVSASAAPLDITSISGIWQNQVGGLNVAGLGTSTITWGDGVDPESGYDFAAAADILSAPLDTPLFLGTFTHTNVPVPIPNLSSVDLNFGFSTNGIPAGIGAIFPFAHNETPNTGGGCCDDFVTITTPIVNIPILVGADTFFFNLLGFSGDGGSTFNNVFSSPEGGGNAAGLYGQITTDRVPTPEPTTLLLLGAGLGLLPFGARRRRRS